MLSDITTLQSDLLKRAERLVTHLESVLPADDPKTAYALICAEALYQVIEGRVLIFGLEPWHNVHNDKRYSPTELLLRLNDKKGNPLPPYDFVMACYQAGLTVELDTILVLSALTQYREHFRDMSEKQVSINLSARFLEMRNQGPIEIILSALENLNLSIKTGEAIIFEIHESAGDVNIDPMILELFKRAGIQFAMDDMAMDGQDVYRFSGFNGFTDFVKIDRDLLMKSETDRELFKNIISFISNQAPGSSIIAEGVRDADHARRLVETHNEIHYVQGRELPTRELFEKQWNKKED